MSRGLVLVQEGLCGGAVQCVEFILRAGFVFGLADLVTGLRGVNLGADAPGNQRTNTIIPSDSIIR